MNLKKVKQRLSEIESMIEKPDFYEAHSLSEATKIINERAECQFIINKQNISFRLSGQNKYYFANQCSQFVKNLEEHGYSNSRYKEEILENGISFHKHSINVGFSPYGRDLERFNNSKELLSFVVGYNRAMEAV